MSFVSTVVQNLKTEAPVAYSGFLYHSNGTREEKGQVRVIQTSWFKVCIISHQFVEPCHGLCTILASYLLTTACLPLRWLHPFTVVQIICIRRALRPSPLSKVPMSVFCSNVASRQGITQRTISHPATDGQHPFIEVMPLSVAQWHSVY